VIASCACGSVELDAIGAPIVGAVCYCDDCQTGARRIQALSNAAPVQDGDGGTAYLLYRKDRVTCTKGAERLEGLKIRDKSATNRVVASCCSAAMMLNFDDGKPWVSVYRARFEGDVPPLQMRINTRFRVGSSPLPNDLPNYAGFPLRFIARLVRAWVAVRLGR
jgi:hypothetical protein